MVKDSELHRIVASCIIYDAEGKFLIIRRSPHAPVFPDIWAVPGGALSREDYEGSRHTSPNGGWEDPLGIALRREIREEVNLEVGKFKYLSNFSHIRPDGIAVAGVRFSAPYRSGDIKLNTEHVDYKWIWAGKLEHFRLLGTIPNDIRQIDRWLNKKSKRLARAA